MRVSIVLIVATLTAPLVMSMTEEEEEDYKRPQKYFLEMQELRAKGKSWKEVEAIMGIWSSEDEEQKFPEHIEPKGPHLGRQAKPGTTFSPYDVDPEKSWQILIELVNQMYLIEARGQALLLEIRDEQEPKNMKYTLPMIKYVSELDYDSIEKME